MSLLTEFASGYSFPLDDYQLDGCRALLEGSGVLVAAPTGAGKTVVGEFGVFLAVANSRKCFYTTPIKALSNQKYHDLVERYGPDRVGLLTGDQSINSEAQIVVMTTEVLRNMIYAASPTLNHLGYVVLDEVHYLADRFRGAVWEEVILGLAESVQIVALSATVSNVEDFGAWLDEVRGSVVTVVSERRPVPLYQHVLVGRRLVDLFEGVAPTALDSPTNRAAKVNRELLRVARSESMRVRDDARRPRGRSGRGKSGGSQYGGDTHPRFAKYRTSRSDVARTLRQAQLLPAIYFIFSRAGCDAAVEQVLGSGIVLTSPQEARLLGSIADQHAAALEPNDLEALGYEDFRLALVNGVAAHHAGQIPAFKAIVEEGFRTGALKVVFATETLALGINMPARTVALEKLSKYNGEAHVDITAGEYTQLTGRAGRRGIDVEGHAVVLWQPGMDPRAVAGLASRRTYPLKSSFAPTYNMAVNLIATMGRVRARDLLDQSFSQYLSDKTVVQATRKEQRVRRDVQELMGQISCHLGDFMGYARLREELSQLESTSAKHRRAERLASTADSLASLMMGDVIWVPRTGWCVVLRTGRRQAKDAQPWVQTLAVDHSVAKLEPEDFGVPVAVGGRIRVPRQFRLRERSDRRSLIAALAAKIDTLDEPQIADVPTDVSHAERIAQLRQEIRSHDCHACEEREVHAVAAARVLRLEREARASQASALGRANSLGVQFDRVCAVLEELGYLAGEELTEAGNKLRRIYNELDLVAAEAIRRGVFLGLDAPQLGAVLSSLVYESRPLRGALPRMPDRASERAQSELRTVWREVGVVERRHARDRGRDLDIGFAEGIWRWASGQDLEKTLRHAPLAPGDFVRWVRQVIDLASQVGQAAGPGDLRRTCRTLVDSLRRGVVAADMAEE
ncbi:RNA helicase [Tessaracoccus sp. OH4464_COT-324]|uniref:DEAD/DEAH box helicase n=1 Tax=Tessaracoccus sp. OH4464_COT-324 TaxID=2491059 RepID=UPI000F638C02|nr:DEAD/DEAH box helicase [Tessaracoccus sp. OH4464_COT-324]RRD47518.1 DEAD/DEAH box helicase [Tessaracoccus sp. OH4464_COT-324]